MIFNFRYILQGIPPITTVAITMYLLLLPSSIVSAQIDTAFRKPTLSNTSLSMKIDRLTSTKFYQMTYVSIPAIAGGLIVKSEDDHFRSLRDEYMPSFSYHYDDYLQYAPGALMLGLKLGGVKGRSSWERMLVSDAFSSLIMAGTIYSLKSTTNVTRPDGSNNHSFPSGHTATAFMTATMMHKEYGGRSPWYSIAAYSMATATALSRQMNNKHWLSDVMVGAGIGILSTEIGYYLADLIFKENGITEYMLPSHFNINDRPSFFGLYLGFNKIPGRYQMTDGSSMTFMTGSNSGLEGASFFHSPYWGIGGRLSVSNMPVNVDKIPTNESLDLISGYVGPYFSFPISARWKAGSKLLAGYVYSPTRTFSSTTIGKSGGISGGTGISLTYVAKHNLGIRLLMDYTVLPPVGSEKGKMMHMLTFGGALNVMF